MLGRTTVRCSLALVALAATAGPLLASVSSKRTPTWAHWWCSSPTAHSAAHLAGGGGVGAALITPMRVLAIHWPHLLPIPLGLAAAIYLWRANARYNAQRPLH